FEMVKSGSEGTRDYKSWSKKEEQILVTCMRELVDERHVEKGNFKLSAPKALERMMHTRLEGYQLLVVPHIKSDVRYFNDKFTALFELKQAFGFGWDETRGCVVADDDVFNGWVKPTNAASRVQTRVGLSEIVGVDGEQVYSYNIPSNVDHNVVMEDLLNQGIDMHVIRLKDVEVEITSKAVGTKVKASDLLWI
ncbi:hypothetical protein LINPERPRIM_LOCUS33140, partial [Linum perenne]